MGGIHGGNAEIPSEPTQEVTQEPRAAPERWDLLQNSASFSSITKSPDPPSVRLLQ